MDRKAVIKHGFIGTFRRRKTPDGEGGLIMVSRWELAGIVEKPPVSVAVIPTDTYDFDVEVPSALASINMAVEAGSKRSVRKSGKTFVEFYATEQPAS